jgi:hypothetical protein
MGIEHSLDRKICVAEFVNNWPWNPVVTVTTENPPGETPDVVFP